MAAPRVEKAYEKHAWIILFALGILSLIIAFPFLLGIDLDPTDEERIIGMTLGQLQASNPRFFDFYTFYLREVGFVYLLSGIFTVAISATAYRRGERWAWYTFLFIAVSLIGGFAIELIYKSPSTWVAALAFVIVSLIGLFLPYRKFFPKSQLAPP